MSEMAVRKKSRYNRNEVVMGYMFALPWILGFLLLMAFPIGYSLFMSMTNMKNQSIFFEMRGFSNYLNILKDGAVWLSIRNTFTYVGLSVPLNIIFSLLMAMLLTSKVRFVKVYRALFYLPTLVTMVAVALLWKQILNSQNGILNSFLGIFGIKGPAWLADYFWATPALVLMGMWSVGGIIVIFLAALTDVPTSMYEAASIDGANSFKKFFVITIPMLSPILFYNILTNMVSAFQVFAQPMLMTNGAYNTKYLGYYIYDTAFNLGRLGYASAMSWIMLIIVLVMAFVIKTLEKFLVFYND